MITLQLAKLLRELLAAGDAAETITSDLLDETEKQKDEP